MRIAWITRSFLDYRIPVYEFLNSLVSGELFLIYSQQFTPERVQGKIEKVIGNRAIGLEGEYSIGYKGNITKEMANTRFRITYQPGIVKILKELKPDVLVGDGFFQWSASAFYYKWRYGVPIVICYERTQHTERRAQWYRTAFRKYMVKHTDSMCCNGRLSKEYAVSIGMEPERITLGHMVADIGDLVRKRDGMTPTDIKEIRSYIGVQTNRLVFLTVARLIPLKGIDHLLNTWRVVRERNKQGTLIISGKGSERYNLEKKCRELSIPDVIFTGNIDYDEIHKYYAAADVFVMPTLEDNWSLVVPEAMACGLPVLCSIYNGCWPELIRENGNGWVFDPVNEHEFAGKLLKFIKARDRLKAMGDVSRQIVSQYTPESAAESVYRACEIAIDHRRSY